MSPGYSIYINTIHSGHLLQFLQCLPISAWYYSKFSINLLFQDFLLYIWSHFRNDPVKKCMLTTTYDYKYNVWVIASWQQMIKSLTEWFTVIKHVQHKQLLLPPSLRTSDSGSCADRFDSSLDDETSRWQWLGLTINVTFVSCLGLTTWM